MRCVTRCVTSKVTAKRRSRPSKDHNAAAGHRWGRGFLVEAGKLWHNRRILRLTGLVASPGGGCLGNPGYWCERKKTVKKTG